MNILINHISLQKQYAQKRSKGFEKESKLDMQMIDMGIALCHFALAAKENNLNITFVQMDPNLSTDMEYIASYKVM